MPCRGRAMCRRGGASHTAPTPSRRRRPCSMKGSPMSYRHPDRRRFGDGIDAHWFFVPAVSLVATCAVVVLLASTPGAGADDLAFRSTVDAELPIAPAAAMPLTVAAHLDDAEPDLAPP